MIQTNQPQNTPKSKPLVKKPRAVDARFSTWSILLFIVAVVVMAVVFVLGINYLMAQYQPNTADTAQNTTFAHDLSIKPINAKMLQTLNETDLDEADTSDDSTNEPVAPKVTDRQEEPTASDTPAMTASISRPEVFEPIPNNPTVLVPRDPTPPPPAYDPVMQPDPEDEKVAAIIDRVRRINDAKLAPVLSQTANNHTISSTEETLPPSE